MRLVDALTYPLSECAEFTPFWELLDSGSDAICAVAPSARSFLVSARFARTPQPTLVVVAGEDAADSFSHDIASFLGHDSVMRFPLRSDVPWSDEAQDAGAVTRRMRSLHSLVRREDCIVVASSRALMRLLPPPSTRVFEPISITCDRGASRFDAPLGYQGTIDALVDIGYVETDVLDAPASFSAKGGSVDVYPADGTGAFRIEFFGDEVDDLRRLVVGTGQTIGSIDTVDVYPVRELVASRRGIARARERILSPSHTNPVLRELLDKLEGGVIDTRSAALLPYLYDSPSQVGDYLGTDVLVVLIEPRALFDDALHAHAALQQDSSGSSITTNGIFCSAPELDFGFCQRATYESVMRIGASPDVSLNVQRADTSGDRDRLFARIRTFVEGGFDTVLCCPNGAARNELELDLVEHSISFIEMTDDSPGSNRLERGVACVSDLDVPLGFVLPQARIAFLPPRARSAMQRPSRRANLDPTDMTFPYTPGDYVVHSAHGVALFKDLVRRDIDGVERDYLLLEYAEQDKLYVPVEQFDRVTRYVGPEGASPRLTRLNTSDWSRALNRARSATRKLAFDLVEVYAMRAAAKGYAYGPDTEWQFQMEQDFPYEETPDQLRAIEDVKADMRSSRPMDRLLCGDVGFGKTEVALRAAFKATQDGKQVMVLCPTTILAQQHYQTFSDRFEPYGVRVDVLSRFRTSSQQKDTLEAFSEGTLDVLVGTHRLLSRDVNPHDLGLVVIDEEQRFGVGHKEQLKNLRSSIDVLTMTATPIPRTMQMGLSGVRDMSVILTPPDDRLPVEVHVGEWDPDVVSGAIEREVERGGQVYYVSNRVKGISDAVERVESAAGGVRIGVAHGQMSKDELESVMEDFSAGELDVLVSTTIIESGIDNPHTNTLIIEDAHRLGLAQMYQLKGRVGRSSRQAYAYFMFPDHIPLTETALARMEAIDDNSALGSGMRIAMRDLEIRGAGTLLGAEQSGNMSAVGFDLFAQMLATAVADAQDGTANDTPLVPNAASDVTVNVGEHAYLPDEYLPDVDERVMLYRRLAFSADEDEVDRLFDETRRAHGQMPAAARNMFLKTRVRVLATQLDARSVSSVAGMVVVEPFDSPKKEAAAFLEGMNARYHGAKRRLRIPFSSIVTGDGDSVLEALCALFRELLNFREADEDT